MTTQDEKHMSRAILIAARGEGFVEPNPMVGCVIVRDGELISEGWHAKFGEAHAEVVALRSAREDINGATLYVTLEPCSHHGKTPPCVDAILAANIRRVVIAQEDPFPAVSGQGIARLREAGVEVTTGVLNQEARRLNEPYLLRLAQKRPWIIAKWAMTLDGKLASRTGDSQWISGDKSREVAHQLRGRVDGILVGRGTSSSDNPLLTARPAGARVATRIVVDTTAQVALASQLVQTANETPVLIAVGKQADRKKCAALTKAGCQVLVCEGELPSERLQFLLEKLTELGMTNILVEGGGVLLGSLLDHGWIDEVHAFIATKLIGGREATAVISGKGIDRAATRSIGRSHRRRHLRARPDPARGVNILLAPRHTWRLAPAGSPTSFDSSFNSGAVSGT